MTAKEYAIRTNCSEAELTKMSSEGWAIQFMQFMPDTKLHVVFVRDAKPSPTVQPAVAVEAVKSLPRVIVPRPIVNRKLPGYTIQGLGDVPITAISKDAPKADHNPVMERARQAAQSAYDRAKEQGEERMRQAASSFRPNFNQGVTTRASSIPRRQLSCRICLHS